MRHFTYEESSRISLKNINAWVAFATHALFYGVCYDCDACSTRNPRRRNFLL